MLSERLASYDSKEVNITAKALVETLNLIRQEINWEDKLLKYTVSEWDYNGTQDYYKVSNDIDIKLSSVCTKELKYWLVSFWKRRYTNGNLIVTSKLLELYLNNSRY